MSMNSLLAAETFFLRPQFVKWLVWALKLIASALEVWFDR